LSVQRKGFETSQGQSIVTILSLVPELPEVVPLIFIKFRYWRREAVSFGVKAILICDLSYPLSAAPFIVFAIAEALRASAWKSLMGASKQPAFNQQNA
jgi:hypothetical protein